MCKTLLHILKITEIGNRERINVDNTRWTM